MSNYYSVLMTGDPVYTGDILYTIDTNGGRIPIEAYSTTDNSSLSYTLRFHDPNFLRLEGNELVVLPNAPIGPTFAQVISSTLYSDWGYMWVYL